MMPPRIEVILSSDGDYEQLTAEIHCDGRFVALLNQDAGPENLAIEFAPAVLDENVVLRKLDLAVFEEGLRLAKERLTT